MRFVKASDVPFLRPWHALRVTTFGGVTVQLHTTDAPYRWHANSGQEVFVVLEGVVDMHYAEAGVTCIRRMFVGDVCHVEDGDLHVAHPLGPARVLVIERSGSE